jgi:hypothetical protein
MFNFTYFHDYDVLLTEDYTVEVILPFGAHDIQAVLPFEMKDQYIDQSFSTLDLWGRPKLVLKRSNVHFSLHNEHFSVTYRYDWRWMLYKPLLMSITVFAMYVASIIYLRASLSFSQDRS